MKNIKIFQVDAFTDQLFSGNPAAVCPLKEWLSEELMQSIAAENNLAETAFFVPKGDLFEIRWFTPTIEVDLCGHATLATAYVLFNFLDYSKRQINFISPRSGSLKVFQENNILFLDFPTDTIEPCDCFLQIKESIGINPNEVWKGKSDYIAVLDNESDILNLKPDLFKIAQLDSRGLVVTAPGTNVDFVSRFFAPQSGIPEDPVTGSAHTSLIPLWSKKLKKEKMNALQLSSRGGKLYCVFKGDRCLIGGDAKLYLQGVLFIE